MSNVTINVANLTIPEHYLETMQDGVIPAITQPSAHLTEYAEKLTDCTGEYTRFITEGTLHVRRRKQRYEDKNPTEVKTGERIIYPNLFVGDSEMSSDDLILKGKLPVTIDRMLTLLQRAAEPYPDRVFLGVEVAGTVDEYGQITPTMDGNCIIPSTATQIVGNVVSPYAKKLNGTAAATGDNTNELTGFGGLMGTNYVGLRGDTARELPQQPMIGGSLATDYSEYASTSAGITLAQTNVIPVNYDPTNSNHADKGLSIEKLYAVRRCLQARHIITGSEGFVMAITPAQEQDLFNEARLQNRDYGFQILKDGRLDSFLGIKFLVTPDVPIVKIGGSASGGDSKWVRSCPVWRKESAAFGVWDDASVEIVKDPMKVDRWLCTTTFGYGAGRKREEDVICVHCYEPELEAFKDMD